MPRPQSWQEALAELKAGNLRHASSRHEHPRRSEARRREITAGQRPVAAILGCADSRVPPELIFDQGLGDLFVIRVAGNVLDDIVLASLEFAVGHLEIPLIVVLGHSSCGAVTAAVAKGVREGHLYSLIAAIETAEAAEGEALPEQVGRATRANIHHVAEGIRGSEPILAGRVEAGTLVVLEAYYKLDSGEVEFIA